MITYYMIGQMISSLLFPSFQETYGRKKIFIICSVINLYTLLAIWGLPDHSERSYGQSSIIILKLLFFVNGLIAAGRQYSGYIYLLDLHPHNSQLIAGSTAQAMDYSFKLAVAWYWMKSSYGWRWIIFMAILINFVGVILCCVLLPESPKWQLITKQYKSCVDSLTALAYINNARDFRPRQDFYKKLE